MTGGATERAVLDASRVTTGRRKGNHAWQGDRRGRKPGAAVVAPREGEIPRKKGHQAGKRFEKQRFLEEVVSIAVREGKGDVPEQEGMRG